MDAITTYFKNTRAEMKHIVWPTGRQIGAYTFAVIAIALITAGMLGLFDVLFTGLVKLF